MGAVLLVAGANGKHRCGGGCDYESSGVFCVAYVFPKPLEQLHLLRRLVAIGAFVALWKYKVDVMKVIVCAVLGLGYTLAMGAM